MTGQIGVCSWSFRPGSPQDLARDAAASGVQAVQLALEPLRTEAWSIEETATVLRRAGLRVVSGMIAAKGEDYSTLETIRETGGVRSDAHWLANLDMAEKSAEVAERLGLKLITFHAGFLPEKRGDSLRRKMLGRIKQIADRFAARKMSVALETGQETAENLLTVLDELAHPAVGVNFDPGNMVLYDMGDPVAALDTLGAYVRQLHIKDALLTETPGTWGKEVVVGTGDVDWPALFGVVKEHGISCNFIVEREAGENTVADVAKARETIAPLFKATVG
jgi:sugar phosphate isomerase/epimerase